MDLRWIKRIKILFQQIIVCTVRSGQSRCRFGRLKLLLISCLIIAGATACQQNQNKIENIVIISIDALKRSALKPYNPRAPYLATLNPFAEQSLIFDKAYSTASWTLPAHASLFTGCYPDRHGAVHQDLKLSSNIQTLAGQLKKSGFQTIGFTDGGYVSQVYGFNNGFDRYDGWTDPSSSLQGLKIPRSGNRSIRAGLSLFDRGIAFINSRKEKDDKFFLFMHTFVVHDYFKLHPWAVNRLPSYGDESDAFYFQCLTGKKSCPQNDWERLKALYQAELHRMDWGLDRFLAALDKQELRKSTLIIFLSDHGEGFYPNQNRIHHRGRLHQDQIRIPLYMSGPGITPGISNTSVSLADIMPTVLDICNIEIPQGLDGSSFAHFLRGEKDTHDRVIYAMEHYSWWEKGRRFDLPTPQDTPLSIAVICGKDWYIKGRKGEEFYDMLNDPTQTNNLTPEFPEISKFRRLAEKRNIYKPSAPKATLGKEILDQLQSLGYIE